MEVEIQESHCASGQDGGGDYFRGTCSYVKTFERSALPVGEVYYLELQGANASADVYLNGEHLAHHDGGYSTWRVNLTDHIQDQNNLTITVDNGVNDTVYPQICVYKINCKPRAELKLA